MLACTTGLSSWRRRFASQPLDKARRALVRAARQQQIELRQTYVRVGKRALFAQSRYAAARQGKRARQLSKKASHLPGTSHSRSRP